MSQPIKMMKKWQVKWESNKRESNDSFFRELKKNVGLTRGSAAKSLTNSNNCAKITVIA